MDNKYEVVITRTWDDWMLRYTSTAYLNDEQESVNYSVTLFGAKWWAKRWLRQCKKEPLVIIRLTDKDI